MKLSIIIVSWNVKDKLRDNLQVIYKSVVTEQCSVTTSETEIFVVDNNSSDKTADMIKNEFPQVKLIANRENFGFARANNQAINQAQGEYILLLNPDMLVFPDTLANMVKWMDENKQAWVAGCHLVDEQGTTIKHVRRFPTVWDQLAIILKLPHIFPGILNNYIINNFNYNRAQAVDSVRGGFFMIKKETIEKVGFLDEKFFVWFEEVDYCRRVYKSGGQVWYTPAAKCTDFVGHSFKQVKRGEAQKYFKNSMLVYFKKWHPAWQFYFLQSAWSLGMILTNAAEWLKIKNRAKT